MPVPMPAMDYRPIPGQVDTGLPANDLTRAALARASNLLVPYQQRYGLKPIAAPGGSAGPAMPEPGVSPAADSRLYEAIHPNTFSQVLQTIMQLVTGRPIPRQEGGPLEEGKKYTVGEGGKPETVVMNPGGGGFAIPQGKGEGQEGQPTWQPGDYGSKPYWQPGDFGGPKPVPSPGEQATRIPYEPIPTQFEQPPMEQIPLATPGVREAVRARMGRGGGLPTRGVGGETIPPVRGIPGTAPGVAGRVYETTLGPLANAGRGAMDWLGEQTGRIVNPFLEQQVVNPLVYMATGLQAPETDYSIPGAGGAGGGGLGPMTGAGGPTGMRTEAREGGRRPVPTAAPAGPTNTLESVWGIGQRELPGGGKEYTLPEGEGTMTVGGPAGPGDVAARQNLLRGIPQGGAYFPGGGGAAGGAAGGGLPGSTLPSGYYGVGTGPGEYAVGSRAYYQDNPQELPMKYAEDMQRMLTPSQDELARENMEMTRLQDMTKNRNIPKTARLAAGQQLNTMIEAREARRASINKQISEAFGQGMQYGGPAQGAETTERLAHAEYMRQMPEIERQKAIAAHQTAIQQSLITAKAHIEGAAITAGAKNELMTGLQNYLTQGARYAADTGGSFDPDEATGRYFRMRQAAGQLDPKIWNNLPAELKTPKMTEKQLRQQAARQGIPKRRVEETIKQYKELGYI